MRGVDIWLPFVTSKIKQYKATDSKTPSSDAHPWISYMALKTTKGQSCEAMTYRKKTGFLQRSNLTKHFSVSARGQIDCSLATHRTLDENFYIKGVLVISGAYFFTGVSSLRMDNAIRSAVPIGTSPTTVTIMSP